MIQVIFRKVIVRVIDITIWGGGRSPREGYINYEYISFLNDLYHDPIRN